MTFRSIPELLSGLTGQEPNLQTKDPDPDPQVWFLWLAGLNIVTDEILHLHLPFRKNGSGSLTLVPLAVLARDAVPD